jgi:hypothetical protein
MTSTPHIGSHYLLLLWDDGVMAMKFRVWVTRHSNVVRLLLEDLCSDLRQPTPDPRTRGDRHPKHYLQSGRQS